MVEEIRPAAVRDLLAGESDVRILDVRTVVEYDAGHIPGSEHAPMHSLSQHVSVLTDAEVIVTVCERGEASRQAVPLIEAYEGVDPDTRVVSLAGGLEEWDGPLDGDDGELVGDESADDARVTTNENE